MKQSKYNLELSRKMTSNFQIFTGSWRRGNSRTLEKFAGGVGTELLLLIFITHKMNHRHNGKLPNLH